MRASEAAGAPAVGMATPCADSDAAQRGRRAVRVVSASAPASRRARARLGEACRRRGDALLPQAAERGKAGKLVLSE